MKDYKNVAEDVFRRSGEVIEENKRRRRKLAEIGVSAACWAAVGAIGFGIWRSSGLHVPDVVIPEEQYANDGTNHSVDTEYTTNQGSLIGEEPSPNLSPDYPVLDNEYIGKDGVDIRCIPIIHLPFQTADRVIGNGQVLFTGALKEKMTPEAKITMELFDVVVECYHDGERVDPTQELLEFERGRTGIKFELETDIDTGMRYIRCQGITCDMLEERLTAYEEYSYIVYLTDNFLDQIVNNKILGRISNIDVEVEEPEHSPDNGTAVISESLKKAIEQYGKEDKNGEVYYSVLVEYYKNGEHIDTTKDIYEFENARGSKLGFESSSNDFGATWVYRMHRNMTVDEIESFEPSSEYGYVLHLYNAYLGYEYKYDDNIINGLYNNGVFF